MAKREAILKTVRDRLLVEAMHRCCLCPEHNDVTDVHHIVPISEDGPNRLARRRPGAWSLWRGHRRWVNASVLFVQRGRRSIALGQIWG